MEGAQAFLWGVATSSYQVEGAPLADGGGPCVWHEFAHTPGRTAGGDTGDVGCDHYHRYREDVALMRQLGVGAYRFSVRWPRLFPNGGERLNPAGWAFYDRLVDALLEARITPFVTLFHWDLPVALEDRGGWRNPEIAPRFADYAAAVAGRFEGRVRHYITLNEPWVTAFDAPMAPGRLSWFAGLRTVHHQLEAHRRAHQAVKAVAPGASVGLTLSNTWHRPATEAPADQEAAARANAFTNFPLYLDPLVTGRLPAEIAGDLAAWMPEAEDWASLSEGATPLDFVGINYYASARVSADPAAPLRHRTVAQPDLPSTAMGWTVDPAGLYELLLSVHRRYGTLPVYITENGAAYPDVLEDGAVHDGERLSYLAAHIRSALRARQEGVDLRGYFVWSLMDNFEWAHGYAKRFGIVYVDRTTLERTVKDSGHWYARLCRGEVSPLAAG